MRSVMTRNRLTVAALARALALPLDDLARVCLDAEEFEDAG